MFKITGEIKLIKEVVQITEKFRKREFVLVDNTSQYPQFISFQLTQDRCELLDTFKLGDIVSVNFNISGREWQSKEGEFKYFNSLDAWRIEKEIVSPNSDIPPMPSSFTDEEEVLPF